MPIPISLGFRGGDWACHSCPRGTPPARLARLLFQNLLLQLRDRFEVALFLSQSAS